VRDLRHTNLGIGEQCRHGFKAVLWQFRRSPARRCGLSLAWVRSRSGCARTLPALLPIAQQSPRSRRCTRNPAFVQIVGQRVSL
jgi:hypothetical protein